MKNEKRREGQKILSRVRKRERAQTNNKKWDLR
jgi:hypothetical protein